MKTRSLIFRVVLQVSICIFSTKGGADWNTGAQESLKKALNQQFNTNKARNVILFLGDGMGVSTVTAARILRGQQQGKRGEETVLAFENFPHLALSKTYTVDRQVADSAATGTAFLCGVKANYFTLGLDETAIYNNCSSQFGAEVSCIFDWFHDEGRSVGIVTNTRITHATPAAGYAKSANRWWEGTDTMVSVDGGCKDIAHQLIKKNSHIQVIFGGGRRYFLKQNAIDPKDGIKNNEKQRLDGIDLIEVAFDFINLTFDLNETINNMFAVLLDPHEVWKKDKEKRKLNAAYVWKTEDFNKINPETTDYALGLFSASHLDYEIDRNKGPLGEPSLSEMTSKAVKILQKNEKGFFLLVESGRIDHAHHDNNAYRALTETLEFEEAIKEAMNLTNEEDTLIVVTADHDHVFNIAGYPKRGNDIFGVVDPIEFWNFPTDGLPFTTLVYGNGPGYEYGNRTNSSLVNTTHPDYVQASAVPKTYETHGGNDVAIYARGPMSHLFHGTHEQHYIAHVMAYASCVGINKQHCVTTKIHVNISLRLISSCWLIFMAICFARNIIFLNYHLNSLSIL